MRRTAQHVEQHEEQPLYHHDLSKTSVSVQGITDEALPVTCNFQYATTKAQRHRVGLLVLVKIFCWIKTSLKKEFQPFPTSISQF